MKEPESHNDIVAAPKKVGTKESMTAALGAPILLSLIAVPAALAIHTFRPVDMLELAAPNAYAPPRCAYRITNDNDGLVPVDLQTGERIGFFERYPDGGVQLTTGDGFAPDALPCIRRAGYADRIDKVPAYWTPST